MPGRCAEARTSPVTLISGFSCAWFRSRPTNLVGPAVSALSLVVSVPAAAAAAARSAASDVSSAAAGATAAGLRPSAARKLSSWALSARTWAARESIWRWVRCCAEPAPGRATSPASAAITAYRCRLIVERLLFQGSTAGDPPLRSGSARGGGTAGLLQPGAGRRSGWGAEAGKARRRRDRRRGHSALGVRRRRGERPCLLRLHAPIRVVAQRAAQLVVQREAAGVVPRLDVGRRAEPLRRVHQRHQPPGEPLDDQERRGERHGAAPALRRRCDHALPTVAVIRMLSRGPRA